MRFLPHFAERFGGFIDVFDRFAAVARLFCQIVIVYPGEAGVMFMAVFTVRFVRCSFVVLSASSVVT